jgi:predicted Zn-dependent protease
VLSHEYVADRCAAETVGTLQAASALIQLELRQRSLAAFEQQFFRQARQDPNAPQDGFTQQMKALRQPIAADDRNAWLQEALAKKTGYEDTHPCLRDRLAALGYGTTQVEFLLDQTSTQSAAEVYLGEYLQVLLAKGDRAWSIDYAAVWHQHHRRFLKACAELEPLAEQLKQEPENEAIELEYAEKTWKLIDGDEALPLYEDILRRKPSQSEALYAIGQILLRKGDLAGLEKIEQAMTLRSTLTVNGCQLMYRFWVKRGDWECAKQYLDRAEKYYRRSPT